MTTRLNEYVEIHEWDRRRLRSNQKVVRNRAYTYRFGMILASLKSWRSQLFKNAKITPTDKYKPDPGPLSDSTLFLNFHIFIQTRHWTPDFKVHVFLSFKGIFFILFLST